MEDIVKELLVEQIKEKKISVRDLHKQIEKICTSDNSHVWFSISTLERRLQNPKDITSEELLLIRDAVKSLISNATWIHMRRNITNSLREKYISQIDEAVSNGFALHQQLKNYNNIIDADDFCIKIKAFYRNASKDIQKRWLKILPVYLSLPDLTKACIMCGSYIGRSVEKNALYEQKILLFVDYFPIFQGVNIINHLSNNDIALLSDLLKLASISFDYELIPDYYRTYAVNKDLIKIPEMSPIQGIEEEYFLTIVKNYKHSIIDYQVTPEDFIRGLCFILYLERIEWLLAYASSIFYYNLNEIERKTDPNREYYDRGCTGFRFTEKELEYLCELLYTIEN